MMHALQALADSIPLVAAGRSAEALKTLLKLWKGVSNLRKAHIESSSQSPEASSGLSSNLNTPPPPPEASTIARLLGQVSTPMKSTNMA
jgi:hypothetical protein